MTSRHPVLVYSLLRAAVLAVTVGVLALVGFRGLVLLALAILVSGALSLVLLRHQRDAVAVSVAERAERTRARLTEARSSEDDA